jgi:hypothetical protein
VFYEDDLEDETFAILCVRKRDDGFVSMHGEQKEHRMFIWKGLCIEEDEDEAKQFVRQTLNHYWGETFEDLDIKIQEEIPGEESEEFLNFFD